MSDPAAKETPADGAEAKPKLNGRTDVVTHRIVVLSLGATVILSGISMTLLQALGRETPKELSHIASVAIGALAMTLSAIMRPH